MELVPGGGKRPQTPHWLTLQGGGAATGSVLPKMTAIRGGTGNGPGRPRGRPRKIPVPPPIAAILAVPPPLPRPAAAGVWGRSPPPGRYCPKWRRLGAELEMVRVDPGVDPAKCQFRPQSPPFWQYRPAAAGVWGRVPPPGRYCPKW